MTTTAIELRPQQVATLQKLREGFAQGHRSLMLYGPTGFGKTELAIALMAAADAKGRRSAMVLDRIVLCNQTSARLDKYGIGHGVMQAGHWRYRPYERIQICSAQTLEKRGDFPGLDLLIVDEAHQTRKQTAAFIANNPTVKVVGLSASPFTRGLGRVYQGVVAATTTEELVGAGYLVPLRVFLAKQIDMTGAKKVAGEWSDKDASERGIQITGDVVAEWVAKTNEVFGGPRKTIVFCAGVAHGADLAAKFAAAGYNFVSISYKDTDDFKAQAVAEFAKPNSTIHGLIATDILTKGFDVPDAVIGISARPFSKSLSSHVQQLGRVMRPHPSKAFAMWLDFSGNYLRFLDDWEGVYANGPGKLDDGREKPKPEPTEREKKVATCPKCSAIFSPRSDTCAHCGYTRLRRNDVVVLPGELQEMQQRSAAESEKRKAFLEQLRYIAADRGYKPAWAAVKFREKFGSWPPDSFGDGVRRPDSDVERWVRSTQIKWAHSQRRRAQSERRA